MDGYNLLLGGGGSRSLWLTPQVHADDLVLERVNDVYKGPTTRQQLRAARQRQWTWTDLLAF